jgi:hypothetical protein
VNRRTCDASKDQQQEELPDCTHRGLRVSIARKWSGYGSYLIACTSLVHRLASVECYRAPKA